MSVAIMTVSETRTWLRAIGLLNVRLPKTPDRVIYVDQPNGGLWRITLHTSGGYVIEPYPEKVAR